VGVCFLPMMAVYYYLHTLRTQQSVMPECFEA